VSGGEVGNCSFDQAKTQGWREGDEGRNKDEGRAGVKQIGEMKKTEVFWHGCTSGKLP